MLLVRYVPAVLAALALSRARAAPMTYRVDPDHTFPSVEADHMGLSVWRGKFNRSRGTVKCMPHPMLKRAWCGTDAYATLDREAFGIVAGNEWGLSMDVGMRIQVEAVAVPAPP